MTQDHPVTDKLNKKRKASEKQLEHLRYARAIKRLRKDEMKVMDPEKNSSGLGYYPKYLVKETVEEIATSFFNKYQELAEAEHPFPETKELPEHVEESPQPPTESVPLPKEGSAFSPFSTFLNYSTLLIPIISTMVVAYRNRNLVMDGTSSLSPLAHAYSTM